MVNMLLSKLPILRKEEGQDTFEYLLVIGVLVVAVVGGAIAFPGLITTVTTFVTNAVTGLFS